MLGKFGGKYTRKYSLAREYTRGNWITSWFYQKIQSGKKQQIRMLPINYWSKQDKNKAVWETCDSFPPNTQFQKLARAKMDFARIRNSNENDKQYMAKYICPKRQSVQIINKVELCQPEALKCLHTGTVTGACNGWYSKKNFHLFSPSCLIELLSSFRIYGFNLRRI